MRMSLSRRDGLFGDPGADTIHGRGQREHVTQSVVSIIILTYIYYYYLVWYQISFESIYVQGEPKKRTFSKHNRFS